MATGQDDERHSFDNNTQTPFDTKNIEAEREQIEAEQQAEWEAEQADDAVRVPVDEPGTVGVETAGESTRVTEDKPEPDYSDDGPTGSIGEVPVGLFVVTGRGTLLLVTGNNRDGTRVQVQAQKKSGDWGRASKEADYQVRVPRQVSGDCKQAALDSLGKRTRKNVEAANTIEAEGDDGTGQTEVEAHRAKLAAVGIPTDADGYTVRGKTPDGRLIVDAPGRLAIGRADPAADEAPADDAGGSQAQFFEDLEAAKQAGKRMIKDVAERGAQREFVLVGPLPEDDGLHRVHRKGCQDVPKDADLCFEFTVNDPDRNLLPGFRTS